MRSGRRDTKTEFIFHGNSIVGWSSDLLLRTLTLALDKLVARKTDPILRGVPGTSWVPAGDAEEIVGKVIGLALSGNRAAGMISGGELSIIEQHLSLAAQLHLPLTIIESCNPESIGDHGCRSLGRAAQSGMFQMHAGNVQEALDFALVCTRIAERSLLPGLCTQDAIISRFDVASVQSHESGLIDAFLGQSEEQIESTTEAQRMTLGGTRRRVPTMLNPAMPAGLNPRFVGEERRLVEPAHASFFISELDSIIEESFDEFGALTGRFYSPVDTYRVEDADYVVITSGSVGETIMDMVDFSRDHSRVRVGAARLRVLHPHPDESIRKILTGRRGVTILDPGNFGAGTTESIRAALGSDEPPLHTLEMAGSPIPSAGEWNALIENMTSTAGRTKFYIVPDVSRDRSRVPALERMDQVLQKAYTRVPWITSENAGPAATASLYPIHLFGEPFAVLAEGAGLLAQTLSTVTGMDARGREGGGSPDVYLLNLGVPNGCSAVLNTSLLGHEGVLNGLAPRSAVVVLSQEDKQHFWAAQPESFRRTVSEHDLTVYAVPPFDSAPDEKSTDLRNQLAVHTLLGAVLRVAFEGRVPIDEIGDRLTEVLTHEGVPSGIRSELVDAVKHGFRTAERISHSEAPVRSTPEPASPWTLRGTAEGDNTVFDAARFWSSIGFGLAEGRTSLLAPDPYLSSRVVPAQIGIVGARSSTSPPQWLPENCTGCGLCWSYCPHSALPTTAAGVGEFIEAARTRVEARGDSTMQVQRLGKHLVKRVHKLVADDELHRYTGLGDACDEALTQLIDAAGLDSEAEHETRTEFESVFEEIRMVPISRTESFFEAREQASRGSGQVISINVDPDACTSCGICSFVCQDDAFDSHPGVPPTIQDLRRTREMVSTVTTVRRDAGSTLEEPPDGDLSRLLLEPDSYYAVLGGGRADPGSGTRMAVHLVAATVKSLAKRDRERLRSRVSELANSLKQGIEKSLSNSLKVNDFDEFASRLRSLSEGSGTIDVSQLIPDDSRSVDTTRLQDLSQSLLDLEWLGEQLSDSGRLASGMVAVFGDAPTLTRDAGFSSNPFVFPWINAEDCDPFSVADGVYEGMLPDVLRAVEVLRRADSVAGDTFDSVNAEEVSPESLTADEWALMPTVCVFTEKLDRSSRSGNATQRPLLAFWLDRLTEKPRPGLSVPAMADPGWFLAQTVPAFPEHFLTVVKEAKKARVPSLVRLYTPEPEDDGFPNHRTVARMKSAVASRVFPLYVYRPDGSLEWTPRWSLNGNPDRDNDWAADESPLTAADWLVVEERFTHLFTALPRSSWNESQVGVEEYFKLAGPEREERTAFVEVQGSDGNPRRLALTEEGISHCTAYRSNWRLLQEMAGIRSSLLEIARNQVEEELRGTWEAERERLREESDTRIAEIQSEYEAEFRDKLTTRMLALSGFDGSNATLANWLAEMEQQGRADQVQASVESDGGE